MTDTTKVKAQAVQAMIAALRSVPREQRDEAIELARLLVEPPEQAPAAPRPVRRPAVKLGSGKVTKRRRTARKPRKGPDRKNAAIYAAIKATPGRPIAELAEIAYPGDDNGNHKTRAILWNLKKKGLINNPRPGYWEATNQRQNS